MTPSHYPTSSHGESEEDAKLKFITPAIERAGWNKHANEIRMEYTISPGRVNLDGTKAKRGAPKKADYVLFARPNYPVAVVEAKSGGKPSNHGLQQAIDYAKDLGVPFAYSTNGKEFVEFDASRGSIRTLPMNGFPTKSELAARLDRCNADLYGGVLTPEARRAVEQPYYLGQGFNEPRYYQRVAINRTVEAIARGRERSLLVMATGTGKTYTAFQIIYRLLKSGLKRKILYLADRNVLVDQSIMQDFKPLSKSVHKIDAARENKTTLGAYEVYFSLYQQLVGEDGEEKFRDLFDPDFFDLVVVDECHRGSAKDNSCWRKILDYFSSASQIGMTATPKETEDVSNINYFGKPLYTYSLKNGVNDGFLAPFRVVNVKTDISDGWRPSPGQLDANGVEIPNRVYNNADYDKNIVILERTQQVAAHITRYLKKTDRMARTIVFCPTTEAAARMRDALVNLNKDMMSENSDYVVRITGDDDYGAAKLKAFISTGERYPVIATTSKLLSTGVDCKLVKLIVLDEPIASMTEFKQIIGRGTRLREECGKTHFTVMDFRNVTRLFNDPDWDGPIEQDPTYDPDAPDVPKPEDKGPKKPNEEHVVPIVDRDGCSVTIVGEVVSILDPTGKIRTENIVDYTRRNLLGEYSNLEGFVRRWRESTNHSQLREWLRELNVDIDELKKREEMTETDDFDFLCHVAFDRKPLTRRERARKTMGTGFFDKYSGPAREVLETLMDVYMNFDVVEIEGMDALKNPSFEKFGKPSKIVALFGGKEQYLETVKALERAMYSEEAA